MRADAQCTQWIRNRFEWALDSGSILLLSPCSNSLCVQRLSRYVSLLQYDTCVLFPFAFAVAFVTVVCWGRFRCNIHTTHRERRCAVSRRKSLLVLRFVNWLHISLLIELKYIVYVSNDVIGIHHHHPQMCNQIQHVNNKVDNGIPLTATAASTTLHIRTSHISKRETEWETEEESQLQYWHLRTYVVNWLPHRQFMQICAFDWTWREASAHVRMQMILAHFYLSISR